MVRCSTPSFLVPGIMCHAMFLRSVAFPIGSCWSPRQAMVFGRQTSLAVRCFTTNGSSIELTKCCSGWRHPWNNPRCAVS